MQIASSVLVTQYNPAWCRDVIIAIRKFSPLVLIHSLIPFLFHDFDCRAYSHWIPHISIFMHTPREMVSHFVSATYTNGDGDTLACRQNAVFAFAVVPTAISFQKRQRGWNTECAMTARPPSSRSFYPAGKRFVIGHRRCDVHCY